MDKDKRHGGACEAETIKERNSKVKGGLLPGGPKLFNNLPKKVRNMTKVDVKEFKEALDDILSKIPDEPKVEGLVPAAMSDRAEHSNSLHKQMKGSRRRT